MATVQAERRLAAILAADVVGYSRLVEADEAATLDAIRRLRREVIDALLAERHGRIVKLMGDGAIVEFASVVDAVACAVAIQRGIASRQADVPVDRRIVFRMGVNLGDVVVDGEDLLGDGVNVAARLEQLCEPGGVLVSGTAYDHLQGRLGLPLDFAGEQQVKNIARPVRAYRVRLDGKAPRRRLALPRPRRWAAAAALLLAALGAGGWWWLRPVPAASDQPSIAVLPFVNLSGDPAQDYFGQGVAEDIITALATFPAIRVVSRTSSFVYDKPVKVQQIGQELGVRYVLEGSVRKSADKANVTAQLIDATTGDHVWASRYDEQGADIAAMQEQVADQVYDSVAGLKGQLRKDEERQAWGKAGPSLTEYDYYLRGHQLFMRFTPEDVARAAAIWEEGLARFPDSGLLKIKLGFAYLEPYLDGWSTDRAATVDRAWAVAKDAALAEDKSQLETWLGHWLMALLYAWHDRDYQRAADEAEAAVRITPNDTQELMALSYIASSAGRYDEAIRWAETVLARDPRPQPWAYTNLGWAYYAVGRYQDALDVMAKNKDTWPLNLAAVHVRLGRLDEARAIVARFLKEKPGFTLAADEAPFMLAQDQLKRTYFDDLRAAGMPEG